MTYQDQMENLSALLEKLPKSVQDRLRDLDVESTVFHIGNKHGLIIREIGDIYEEMAKRMRGETPPEKFASNIQAKLEDENKSKATFVIADIDKEVFQKIREAMKYASENTVRLQSSAVPEEELHLKRDDLLSHIENPVAAPAIPAKNLHIDLTIPEIEAPKEARPASIASKEDSIGKLGSLGAREASSPSTKTAPPVNLPTGEVTLPPPPSKTRPASGIAEGIGSRVQGLEKPNTGSLIGEKLEKPTSTPASRTTYTVDPYREQPK